MLVQDYQTLLNTTCWVHLDTLFDDVGDLIDSSFSSNIV